MLLALGLIALIWFLTRDRDGDTADTAAAATTTDTTTTANNSNSYAARGDWNSVDWNAPAVNYDEITDKNISVRGNEQYGIYGIGEDILFDEGKATIRSDAEANLKQITGSINKRYNGGDIRVYGFTDSKGSTEANKQLAEQRAEAVESWLSKNGISQDKVSVHPVGEAQPQASNNTEEGRQQNRRVEIVARNTSNAAGQ